MLSSGRGLIVGFVCVDWCYNMNVKIWHNLVVLLFCFVMWKCSARVEQRKERRATFVTTHYSFFCSIATTPKTRCLLEVLRLLHSLHFCDTVVDEGVRQFFEVLHFMHVNPRFLAKWFWHFPCMYDPPSMAAWRGVLHLPLQQILPRWVVNISLWRQELEAI